MLLGRFQVLAVGRGVHQIADLDRDRRLDPDYPAVAVRVAVDRLRTIAQDLVHLEDIAGDGSEDLGDRLDRFDGPELHPGLDRRPDRGQIDVDNVAELSLCVVRDADPRRRALAADPLVVLRIKKVVGNVHGFLL